MSEPLEKNSLECRSDKRWEQPSPKLIPKIITFGPELQNICTHVNVRKKFLGLDGISVYHTFGKVIKAMLYASAYALNQFHQFSVYNLLPHAIEYIEFFKVIIYKTK